MSSFRLAFCAFASLLSIDACLQHVSSAPVLENVPHDDLVHKMQKRNKCRSVPNLAALKEFKVEDEDTWFKQAIRRIRRTPEIVEEGLHTMVSALSSIRRNNASKNLLEMDDSSDNSDDELDSLDNEGRMRRLGMRGSVSLSALDTRRGSALSRSKSFVVSPPSRVRQPMKRNDASADFGKLAKLDLNTERGTGTLRRVYAFTDLLSLDETTA